MKVAKISLNQPCAARSAIDMLHCASWHVEKLFGRHGGLQGYLWCTECRDRSAQIFETGLDAAPASATDAQALDMLRSQMREDFMRDGVVRYAVAFFASEITVLAPSILHCKPTERRRTPVIAFEAHDSDTQLRSHREIVGVGDMSWLAVLAPIVTTGEMQFGGLLPATSTVIP